MIFRRKNVKNVKTIKAEFYSVSIRKWGDKFEVDIRYKAKVGDNQVTQDVEKQFRNLEDAFKFANEYVFDESENNVAS